MDREERAPMHRTSPVLACRSNRFCRLAGANPNTAGQLVRCGIPCQKLQELVYTIRPDLHGGS